jgi:hypothetical protein
MLKNKRSFRYIFYVEKNNLLQGLNGGNNGLEYGCGPIIYPLMG